MEELAVGEAMVGGGVDNGSGGFREQRVAAKEKDKGGNGYGSVGKREAEQRLEAVEGSGIAVEDKIRERERENEGRVCIRL